MKSKLDKTINNHIDAVIETLTFIKNTDNEDFVNQTGSTKYQFLNETLQLSSTINFTPNAGDLLPPKRK